MKINIDLIKDFENDILSEIEKLKEKGFKFLEFDEWKIGRADKDISEDKFKQELIYSYGNLKQRMIDAKSRKIRYANNFERLPDYEEGLKFLEDKIKNGNSLEQHLSRDIFKPRKQNSKLREQDGMLFDFGIYHLHLGTEPDKNFPFLIQGREKVLYCLFDNEFAYFLVIDDHKKWGNLDFLKIVKESFPQKLELWEMKEDSQFINLPINEHERQQFRKKGINSLSELDGKSYMPPGGGINMNGASFLAIRTFQKQKRWFCYIENALKEHFANNLELEKKLNLVTLNLSLQSFQPFTLIDNENGICVEIEFDIENINKILIYKQ